MIRLIAQRALLGLLTLWLVSLLVFAGTELLPGDVAEAVLGQSATPESLHALRLELGLDRPAVLRYLDWLSGLLRFDFGVSLASQVPVNDLIAERVGRTILLAGLAAAIAVPVALAAGLMAAAYPGSRFDRVTSVAALCISAFPEFLLGTILVLIFAVKLAWLPAISYAVEFDSLAQLASSLTLPVLTLAAVIISQIARMTRATMVNLMTAPYIEMAVLKGVRRRRIVLWHALPNAVGPIANVIALNLAYLVSGVVIVETIFAYPGLARLVVDAVASRDFPLIQACAFLFSAAYVVLMLAADIVTIISNPRLRQARS